MLASRIFARTIHSLPLNQALGASALQVTPTFTRRRKRKIDFDPQGLTLEEAVRVIKASLGHYPSSFQSWTFIAHLVGLQAKEVGRPNNTFELHVRTRQDKGAIPIRGLIDLPNPLPQELGILVFAVGEKAKEALVAGARTVGGKELVAEIQDGSHKLDQYDKAFATPEMLKELAKIARILGPKGLMPVTKRGTVREDIGQGIKEIMGKFEFKSDKHGVIHTGIGKIHFSRQAISDNILAVIQFLQDYAKEQNKRSLVERVVLNSTQGPGICLVDIMDFIETQQLEQHQFQP